MYNPEEVLYIIFVVLNSLWVSLSGTPFWKLILKQFDDFLVKILIVAAIVSFLLALINGETGLSAFLEPTVSFRFYKLLAR